MTPRDQEGSFGRGSVSVVEPVRARAVRPSPDCFAGRGQTLLRVDHAPIDAWGATPEASGITLRSGEAPAFRASRSSGGNGKGPCDRSRHSRCGLWREWTTSRPDPHSGIDAEDHYSRTSVSRILRVKISCIEPGNLRCERRLRQYSVHRARIRSKDGGSLPNSVRRGAWRSRSPSDLRCTVALGAPA